MKKPSEAWFKLHAVEQRKLYAHGFLLPNLHSFRLITQQRRSMKASQMRHATLLLQCDIADFHNAVFSNEESGVTLLREMCDDLMIL